MNDSILRQFNEKNGNGQSRDGLIDEPPEDFGAFGWLRGSRERAVMLELRKKNGNIVAVGYSWIEKVEFDPSEGITLHLAGQQIKIRGRNLNADHGQRVRLFQGIARQRVPWIQEADQSAALRAGKLATVVEEIQW